MAEWISTALRFVLEWIRCALPHTKMPKFLVSLVSYFAVAGVAITAKSEIHITIPESLGGDNVSYPLQVGHAFLAAAFLCLVAVTFGMTWARFFCIRIESPKFPTWRDYYLIVTNTGVSEKSVSVWIERVVGFDHPFKDSLHASVPPFQLRWNDDWNDDDAEPPALAQGIPYRLPIFAVCFLKGDTAPNKTVRLSARTKNEFSIIADLDVASRPVIWIKLAFKNAGTARWVSVAVVGPGKREMDGGVMTLIPELKIELHKTGPRTPGFLGRIGLR